MAQPADVPARPASQPPATTPTTSNTAWTGNGRKNRKSVLQSTSEDMWKPNPTNPATSQLLATIFPIQTFQNVSERFAAGQKIYFCPGKFLPRLKFARITKTLQRSKEAARKDTKATQSFFQGSKEAAGTYPTNQSIDKICPGKFLPGLKFARSCNPIRGI